jgi:hypothetical protein
MGVVRKLKPQPGEGAMMLVEEGFGSLREVCIAMHAMQTLAGTASKGGAVSCMPLPVYPCIARAAGVLVGMKMDTAGPSSPLTGVATICLSGGRCGTTLSRVEMLH